MFRNVRVGRYLHQRGFENETEERDNKINSHPGQVSDPTKGKGIKNNETTNEFRINAASCLI